VGEISDIETALEENDDASSRDLNFEGATWEGVTSLLGTLEATFRSCRATDADGEPIHGPTALRAKDVGQAVFTGGSGLVDHVQLFLAHEPDGSPFVEITLWPEAIKRGSNLRKNFLAWADDIARHLGARRYFARHENVSWKVGDSSEGSGVFYVSEVMDRTQP
jgi:hypothetical protein